MGEIQARRSCFNWFPASEISGSHGSTASLRTFDFVYAVRRLLNNQFCCARLPSRLPADWSYTCEKVYATDWIRFAYRQ